MVKRKFVARSLIVALPLLIAAGCTQPQQDTAKVDAAAQQSAEAKQMAMDAMAKAQEAADAANRAAAAAEQAAADAQAASDKADRMMEKSMHK